MQTALVHCAHSRMMPLAEAITRKNPRNPNTHPPSQVRLLAKIIEQTGWRSAPVLSKRSGLFTKGHGRIAAAELLGLTEIPIDEQPYESEAQEMADMVADNRIAELAEIDNASLNEILADLQAVEGFDFNLTGFELPKMEDIKADWPELHEKGQHQITIRYKPEDEAAILKFVNRAALEPAHIGRQMLERVKDIVKA